MITSDFKIEHKADFLFTLANIISTYKGQYGAIISLIQMLFIEMLVSLSPVIILHYYHHHHRHHHRRR